MFVLLGLGSNRSYNSWDSIQLLSQACLMLKKELAQIKFSSVYQTKPMYVEDQQDFYNMAVSGFTEKSAHDLLAFIHTVENSLGRNRKKEIRNGPRTMDIDIEIYGNENISFHDPKNSMADLEIPHPRIMERAFVLIPLLEILDQNADIKDRDLYHKSLGKIGSQGVNKCLSACEFSQILGKTEVIYGRKLKSRESDCN